MSTLSGVASKGEKAKQKYQSLDINNLYRVSRGENLEKQQQKNTLNYKHGMQSLGKVPNARRAPANLPSLKSEHSGTDASVPLVPPGGPGWGKQDSSSATSTTTTPTITTASTSTQNHPPPQQLSSHQAAIALPVQTTIPPQVKHVPNATASGPVAGGGGDKSWSSVMTAPNDTSHPPLYQSPQFQHEFPSLSMTDGQAGGGISGSGTGGQRPDPHHYTPGLSLRPQTEGSWIQGGSRNNCGPDGAPVRSSSVPLGAPPQLSAQVGLQQQQQQQQAPLAPQFRGVLPNFMCKGNFAPNAPLGPNQIPNAMNGRRHDGRPQPRLTEDDVIPRPIIKEEELIRMDEIDKDMGWTAHDDIDYNQKLAFSDDETNLDKGGIRKSEARTPTMMQKESETGEGLNRTWNRQQQQQRTNEEEQWKIRRSQHNKDLEITVQRAKQRKEEEEKRFNESTKQGAAKKLQELEEKMNKRGKEDENVGTISPSVVPPKPIVPADIPLPDFQRDKERDRDSRSRTPNEDKTSRENSFRQMTTIEGKNFAPPRKQHPKSNDPRERDRELREQNGPNYSKHFQMPPRFQKQRNTGAAQNFSHGFPPAKSHSPEREVDDREFKRQSSEDSHRSGPRFADDYDYNRRSANQRDKEPDWHGGDRRERPARPDSRDSRTSRHSRDSEPREHIGSWAETPFEYEEKRRDDRRQVPGPITKDRIEADDMRSEKRNLTQLKRGGAEKKSLDKKDDKDADSKKDDSGPKAWADAVSPHTNDSDNSKFRNETLEGLKGHEDTKKLEKNDGEFNKDDRRGNRNRNYAPSKGWSNNDYHRSNWNKRPQTGGGRGPPRNPRDFHGTDSEGSMDDVNLDGGIHRSPKPVKKSEKDDKNKETKVDKGKPNESGNKDGSKRDGYVPRGEPSRHGRGGGNFRNRGGVGMGKRIDGYGPPPSKSPFGHHEDKKSATISEENASEMSTFSEDKSVKNQQALTAGITAGVRKENKDDKSKVVDDKMKNRKPDLRRGGVKPKRREDENVDSNSDNSDEKNRKSAAAKNSSKSTPINSQPRRQNQPPRLTGDKKPFGSNLVPRQNSSGALRNQPKKEEGKNDQNPLCNAIADISLKNSEGAQEEEEEVSSVQADSDGFQEVKSKKAVKERQKSVEDKPSSKPVPKPDKEQISNIPPLMATPVNPPTVMPQTSKQNFERSRQNKLAPRFAKQRESNRLQKAQFSQQQNICDVPDINKVGQNIYGMKDTVVSSMPNAWDNKSLGTQLTDNVIGERKSIEGQDGSPRTSPNDDKIIGKSSQLQDKAILDGATPPVNTIIFENTNFKSAPGARNSRPSEKSQQARTKLDETMENSSFNKPISDLLCKTDKQNESIMLPFKEDNADIIDLFKSDLSHLDEDRTTTSSSTSTKNLCITRSSTVSASDDLNFKIQSVKKMWETPAEHGGQDDSFSSSFVSDPSSLDPNGAFKGNETTSDDNHEVYSPSPNQVAAAAAAAANNTTNVCKVKPTQQVAGGAGATSQSLSGHQQHSGIMGPSLMGNPLSPPPLQPVIGTGVNLGQPHQYTTNQHMGYQASLGGSNYGLSAIPSPPTVMYNSTTQQLQQTANIYGAFQLDQSGVLGQSRSQYSQYAQYANLGQNASSPYSTQSMYLQTPAHPPPTAQPPPDIYQNLSNYRMGATGPFGQNQQMNNPTTVLISSTSNSLMSASVKPSTQQISAIGTKTGGVGQAYQPQTQQSQQVYMAYEPALQANYLQNAASVMQRAQSGPVQNNVVPALQSTSSYYSGSTGQTGYYQQPGSSTLQSAQLQQHQAGYGLQGNVFGTHSQSTAGLQSFNSHFLSNQMQVAAALNAQQQQQQYRSGLQAPYIKGLSDQSGRSQQLKSPGSQEVISSVFNSAGSQISSPKLRQNCKQPPPQPSPTAQHKYSAHLYQTVGNQQQIGNRYPAPIQRPVNFQQNLNSMQNQKHRTNNTNNKAPSRQYYQSNSIQQNDSKVEDAKITDTLTNSTNTNNSTVANKIGTSSTTAPASDLNKDPINIEESSTLKD